MPIVGSWQEEQPKISKGIVGSWSDDETQVQASISSPTAIQSTPGIIGSWEDTPITPTEQFPQDFWERRREVVGHKKMDMGGTQQISQLGQVAVESFLTEPLKRTYKDIVESGKKALAGEGDILDQVPFKGLRYAAGRLIKEGGLPVPIMNLVMPALLPEEKLQKVKAGKDIEVSEKALKAMGGLNKLIGIYPSAKAAGGVAAAKIKAAPYLAGAPELSQRLVEGATFWGTTQGVDEAYEYLNKEKEFTLKNIVKSGGAIAGGTVIGGILGGINALPNAAIRIPAAGVSRFGYEVAKEKLNPKEPKNTLNKYINTGMQMLLAVFTGLDMNAIKRKMVEGAIDAQTVDKAMESAGQFLPAKFVDAPLTTKTEFLTKVIEKLDAGNAISKVIPEVIEETGLKKVKPLEAKDTQISDIATEKPQVATTEPSATVESLRGIETTLGQSRKPESVYYLDPNIHDRQIVQAEKLPAKAPAESLMPWTQEKLDPGTIEREKDLLLSAEEIATQALQETLSPTAKTPGPTAKKQTKELIALMQRNKIFWHEIEDSFGRKLSKNKPLDIALALQHIKNVSPEIRKQIDEVKKILEIKQRESLDPNIKKRIKDIKKKSYIGIDPLLTDIERLDPNLKDLALQKIERLKYAVEDIGLTKSEKLDPKLRGEDLKQIKYPKKSYSIPKVQVDKNAPIINRVLPDIPTILPDIPTKGRLETWGRWIKTWLGTKKEGLQAQFGKEKGLEIYRALEKMNAAKSLGAKELEKRNLQVFNVPSRVRDHISDILKGINGKDAQGNIKFGALQRSGVIPAKMASEGDILEDGRIVGELHPKNKQVRLTYRKYDTELEYNKLIKKHPKVKGMIDQYLATEEQIVETKLKTQLPAFAHQAFEKQYDIETSRPSATYVPSVMAKRVPLRTKVKNLFKTVRPSGSKFKAGTLAEAGLEERDILKSYTSKQLEYLNKDVTHEAAAKVLSVLLEPMQGHKVTPGYVQLNVNHPQIAEVIKSHADFFKDAGLNIDEKALFQYPASIERYIKLQSPTPFAGKLGEVHDKALRSFNKSVSYITTNYLIRPSTANRNFVSGAIQYNLKTLTHAFEGLLGAGFRPAIEDVKALGTALMPKTIKDIPAELLGKNFFSKLAERESLLGKALIPFSAVEMYFKRASVMADLNSMAYKAANQLNIPANQKAQFIKDFKENFFYDLFHWLRESSDSVTYDYDNMPLFLKYVPKSVVPYPNYAYNKFRMYMEYSPLGLIHEGKGKPLPDIEVTDDKITGFKEVKGGWETLRNRMSKAMAGMTTAYMMWKLADKTVKKREKDMERLALKKIDWEFDTTGRIQFHGDKEVERYLRVYDIPFLGDIMYYREIMQGTATFSDWLSDGLALGPAMVAPLALFGFKRRPDQYKPTSAVVGEQVAGWIPFGAYIRYARVLQDPVKRKTFSNDYGAFRNFMSAIAGRLPGTSEVLESRDTRYDIPAETMKLLFLNVQSIDKQEFLKYQAEQFVSGKVRRRMFGIINKTRGS